MYELVRAYVSNVQAVLSNALVNVAINFLALLHWIVEIAHIGYVWLALDCKDSDEDFGHGDGWQLLACLFTHGEDEKLCEVRISHVYIRLRVDASACILNLD